MKSCLLQRVGHAVNSALFYLYSEVLSTEAIVLQVKSILEAKNVHIDFDSTFKEYTLEEAQAASYRFNREVEGSSKDFVATFPAFSASTALIHSQTLELGNKVLLPPDTLEQLCECDIHTI